MGLVNLEQFDHINQSITLSVITSSGFHCIDRSNKSCKKVIKKNLQKLAASFPGRFKLQHSGGLQNASNVFFRQTKLESSGVTQQFFNSWWLQRTSNLYLSLARLCKSLNLAETVKYWRKKWKNINYFKPTLNFNFWNLYLVYCLSSQLVSLWLNYQQIFKRQFFPLS